jgi:shikimate dehydrogenase
MIMNKPLLKYAILGHAISYSLSPLIHNTAFGIKNINARYDILDFPPEKFTEQISVLKHADYSGFNVTIPYKNKIMDYLDVVDPEAEIIGAVNTIHVDNGKWYGYNTDVTGFLSPLKKVSRTFDTCVILGNGGAARAVLYGLTQDNTIKNIYLCARNRERSAQLISQFADPRIKPCALMDVQKLLPEIDLLVNSTPLGTWPDTNQTPVSDISQLKGTAIVYDLIYKPSLTRLMKEAAQLSSDIILIGGMRMLLSQAARAFGLWTGEEFPYDEVDEAVKKVVDN